MGINSAIRTVEEFLNQAKSALAVREPVGLDPSESARGPRPPSTRGAALLDARAAAAYLNLSVSWVYKAAERGQLPCIRIGAALRFDPEALRAWAQTHASKPVKLKSV